MANYTKMEKARATIVLDHPFFASILLKHPMTARKDIPTLCVTDRGHISYNPDFIETLTNGQIVWALCHEVLHFASAHGPRRGHREHKRWNYAGDAWINDTLGQMNIGESIPGTVTMPGAHQQTVEDIYANLPEGNGNGKGKKGKGGGKSQSGQGQGGGDGDGDPLQGDLDSEGLTEGERAEIEAQVKMEVAEAAQVAKMRGKLPGVLQQFAANMVESRVPWFDILERFMTERVKNDVSWAKPNRRYMPDYYLPVIDGIGAMGEVVVQIDVSGSVSRKEIEHYNGHLKRIVEQCRPSKVHVIYTDTQVQKHVEFEKPEEVNIEFYSGGGTDMPAGFNYIESKGIEPEVFITLTDGYTGWGTPPSYPVIWCISTDQKAPYGENINFRLEE